jgi:hypothetical protein
MTFKKIFGTSSPSRARRMGLSKIHHAGHTYSLEEWVNLIRDVFLLKAGDKVWNPYKQRWDTVKTSTLRRSQRSSVAMENGRLKSKNFGKSLLLDFWIETEEGYMIYDLGKRFES